MPTAAAVGTSLGTDAFVESLLVGRSVNIGPTSSLSAPTSSLSGIRFSREHVPEA